MSCHCFRVNHLAGKKKKKEKKKEKKREKIKKETEFYYINFIIW